MKTIEEFLKETESSEALQNELKAIKDKDALSELLKKYDVDGTVEDLGKALKAKQEDDGELPDKDAEAVAGGAALLYLIFK